MIKLKIYCPYRLPKGFYYSSRTVCLNFTNFIGYKTNLSFEQMKRVKYVESALLAAKDLYTEKIILESILSKLVQGEKSILFKYGLNIPRDSRDVFYALANRNQFVMPDSFEIDWQDEATGYTLLHQATIHRRSLFVGLFQANVDVRDLKGKLPIEYVKDKNIAWKYSLFKVKMKEEASNVDPIAVGAYFHLKQQCDDVYCLKQCCRPVLPEAISFLGFNMKIDPFTELSCNSEYPSTQEPTVVSMSGGGVKVIAFLALLAKQENIKLQQVKKFAGVSAGALLCCILIEYDFNYIEVINIFYRLLPKLFTSNQAFRKCLVQIFGEKTLKTFAKKYDLYILATKIDTDKQRLETIVFHNSNEKLVDVLLASCCAPQVFEPIVINDVTYVDGGLLCNNPLNELASVFSNELILSLVATSDPLLSPIPIFPFKQIYNILNTLTLVKDAVPSTYLREGNVSILKQHNNKVIEATSKPYKIDSFTRNRKDIYKLVKHYCETSTWQEY